MPLEASPESVLGVAGTRESVNPGREALKAAGVAGSSELPLDHLLGLQEAGNLT